MQIMLSRRATLLVTAMACAWPGAVLAQSTPGAGQATADTQGQMAAGGLGDIIVTSRRRTESVQDVPVAVTAFSAEQIQRRDLTNLERIAAATPQLTVGRASNGAGAQLSLRGISSSATSIGIEQSVAVVVDGVYYGQGRVINEGFFDLARVEVLKGPQALFFGKNATAGAISITTADPGPDLEVIGRVGYEFGSRQLTGEAIVSVPVTDTLGVRLAVRGSRMWGGYYENLADPQPYTTFDVATGNLTSHVGAPSTRDQPGERELVGRLTVKWDPTDRLTATLKLSGTSNKVDGNGWNYAPVNCLGGVTANNPNYPCAADFKIYQNDFPAAIAAETPYARDGGIYNEYKSWQVTGTINYRADAFDLTSITAYNWNGNDWGCDCDFLGAPVWATESSDFDAFSQEVRGLTKFDGPFNVMLGGLYQKTTRDFFQTVLFAGVEDSSAPAGNRYVAYSKLSQTKGETLSAYGQAIWKIVPRLEATAGVRYTHETKRSFFTQPWVNPLLTGIFRPESAAVDGTVFGDQTFNDWSPEFALSYKPTEDILLYAAYKSAYKSGGFSNSAINSSQSADPAGDMLFDPERGRGVEAGIKSTLLDNQLRLNLTLYSFKYTDLQVDYFNAQIFAYQTYNAGESRARGAELEFQFAPRGLDGLSLSGSINYNKATYREFLAPCWSGQTLAQGCTLFGPNNAPFQDLSGASTALAPEWTGNIGVNYVTTMASGMQIGGNVDLRYSSSYLGSAFGDERTRQSDYAVLDAGIFLGSANDRWEVALIGKNLTNRFYLLGGGTAPLTGSGTGTAGGIGGDILGYGSTPRTVRMQLTVRY